MKGVALGASIVIRAGEMAPKTKMPNDKSRFIRLKSGISLSGEVPGEPSCTFAIAQQWPALKFALCKVQVDRVRSQDAIGQQNSEEVYKSPIPIVIIGRLKKHSTLRFDEEEGKAFTILGTDEQMRNAVELVGPAEAAILKHGRAVSWKDILRLDKALNGAERKHLRDNDCVDVIHTPAVFVEGTVFASE